ncbi:MAG: hypothetical protein HYY78_01915 [Betaproteobacteria bacterium]|nr:hypothetical protein [Betaproteobacteria bacterium]
MRLTASAPGKWDPDFRAIRIYASTVQGFTPASENIVFDGGVIPENGETLAADVSGLDPGTTYYARYQLFDLLGGGDISDEFSFTTQRVVDRATPYGPDSTTYTSTKTDVAGPKVVAMIEHTNYPAVPAQLSATFAAQLTVGPLDNGVTQYWTAIRYTSKPASDGTCALSWAGVGGSKYDVVGTGTDFTLLAAKDYIYFGPGKPLATVSSITDATHMRVALYPASSAVAGTDFPVSGWTFQAYHHTSGLAQQCDPQSDVREMLASATQDISVRTGFPMVLDGAIGVALFALAQSSTGGGASYYCEVKQSSLDSQWVIGSGA